MSNPSFIRFKKNRDLGNILGDTLNFLREEGQPLIGVVLKVAIVPMILSIGAALYYNYVNAKNQLALQDQSEYAQPLFDTSDLGTTMISLLFMALSFIVTYSLIGSATLSYIRSYQENNGKVDFDRVSQLIKEKFGSYVGLSILNGIVVIVGFILCFLPGFYFWGTLALAPCILVFDDKGALDSFGDSFSYTKSHFWNTLGMIFVIWLILFVLGIIVNLPVTLYSGVDFDFLSQGKALDMDNLIVDPIYIVLTMVSYMVGFFFEIIIMISRAFMFFDIEEQERPSTPDVIDTIGTE